MGIQCPPASALTWETQLSGRYRLYRASNAATQSMTAWATGSGEGVANETRQRVPMAANANSLEPGPLPRRAPSRIRVRTASPCFTKSMLH